MRTRVNTIEATFERSRVNVKVERGSTFTFTRDLGRDPFNQNSNRSDREKRTTSKGEPVFSKLFRLDRTDPLSFGPKFPESLVEWIAPLPYIVSISFTRVKFTCVRTEKLCDSGNPPLGPVRTSRFRCAKSNANEQGQ